LCMAVIQIRWWSMWRLSRRTTRLPFRMRTCWGWFRTNVSCHLRVLDTFRVILQDQPTSLRNLMVTWINLRWYHLISIVKDQTLCISWTTFHPTPTSNMFKPRQPPIEQVDIKLGYSREMITRVSLEKLEFRCLTLSRMQPLLNPKGEET
jgi:hypothetical protein